MSTKQLEFDLTTPQEASMFLDEALSSCDLLAPEVQAVVKCLAFNAARYLIQTDTLADVRERFYAEGTAVIRDNPGSVSQANQLNVGQLRNPSTHEAVIRGRALGVIEAIAALAIPRPPDETDAAQKIDPGAYWNDKIFQLTAFVTLG